MRCNSAIRPGAVGPDIQELAIRPRIGVRMPPPIEPENVNSTSVAAGDHEPGVDLLAFGYVAALERLVETFLGWVFCSLGIVAPRPSRSPHLSGVELVHYADEIIEEGSHHAPMTTSRIRKPSRIDSGTPTK